MQRRHVVLLSFALTGAVAPFAACSSGGGAAADGGAGGSQDGQVVETGFPAPPNDAAASSDAAADATTPVDATSPADAAQADSAIDAQSDSQTDADAGSDAGADAEDASTADALASAACQPLFPSADEIMDAAGCSSPEALFDAGPLCTVPCSSLSEDGTGSCSVPCTAPACCGGDYGIPVQLENGSTICARWGTSIDAGCGTACTECGGYTCPGNSLCSADCFCNVNNGFLSPTGALPPDPLCIAGWFDAGNDDSGCSGSYSGAGGAGGCARCRQ